jgi:hypothetical protein
VRLVTHEEKRAPGGTCPGPYISDASRIGDLYFPSSPSRSMDTGISNLYRLLTVEIRGSVAK